VKELCVVMPKTSRKKDFIWTNDEVELLLIVTHQYKIQQLTEGMSWESVKSKDAEILELLKGELPDMDEEAGNLVKDYPYRKEELTKEILMTKLKVIRNKYRQVRNNSQPTFL
jgi:hypothetical protein